MTPSNNDNGHTPRRMEFRCRDRSCNRKLFEGYLCAHSYVEIRCPRCGRMNVYDVPVVVEKVEKEAVIIAVNVEAQ